MKTIRKKGCTLGLVILMTLTINERLLLFKKDDVFQEEENKGEIAIDMNLPHTKYKLLNEKIKATIDYYQEEFSNTEKGVQNNFSYFLDTTYEEYKYKNLVSIVLFITVFTGGAHPNHYIEAINYDTLGGEIITLDNLKRINPNILKVLMEESRKMLLLNKVFQDKTIYEMMISGTQDKDENYQNFAFTDKGLKVFFSRYQVAPYFYGSYYITIPYQTLKIDNLFD